MISVSIPSQLYYMVKNPMKVKVNTNRYIVTAGSKAKLILSFSNTSAAIGQTILFVTQSGLSISMVFASLLGDSGTKLRTNTTSLTLAAFIQQVAEDFAANYYLQEYFKITYGATSITLQAKVVGAEYTTACTSSATGISVSTQLAGLNLVIADNHRIRMDVYAEAVYSSNSFKKIGSLELEPFNNTAEFDISELLRWNFTKCDLPTFMELNITKCRHGLTRYYLVTAERFGSPSVLKLAHTSDKYLAFFGGISYQEFPYQTLLYDHIWSVQKYLTWQPTTKDGYSDSQDYLYFIVPRSISIFRVKVVAYYTDGTNTTAYPFVETAINYEIYRFPTGYGQLVQIAGVFDTLKVVAYYEVFVDDNISTILADKMTYRMNYRARYEKQLFIFNNSPAGMETLETTGELVTGIQIEAFSAERAAQFSYSVIDGERFKSYSEKQDVFKISTGWISRERANQVIDELFLAEFVYIADYEKSQWLPVVINKSTVEKHKSLQDLIAVNYEYAYAFTNRVTVGTITPVALPNIYVNPNATAVVLTTSDLQPIQININPPLPQ